ncbi:hypothetical protein H5410_033992 [Solanum commersonii]|uniref:Uncharacterized protein n=1 Tax=Solanum commersonii TaxID=4109 RepID=A0A9J5YUR0_SOLCO|nr:hypothetical protein H5410_033992 [Solanum commersonii]
MNGGRASLRAIRNLSLSRLLIIISDYRVSLFVATAAAAALQVFVQLNSAPHEGSNRQLVICFVYALFGRYHVLDQVVYC